MLQLAHLDEVQGVKWKRFEPMNELIRGFRRGELTIFSGRTGSGKTTFMSEYSLDLCMQVLSFDTIEKLLFSVGHMFARFCNVKLSVHIMF